MPPAAGADNDVARHRRLPESAVRGVDRELARGGRDLDRRMGQDILAELRLEREAVHTVPTVKTIIVEGVTVDARYVR